ncbi:putative sugar phosphate/phosphate translocator [Hibiscus syriacus]|uniref:Sugar phosphate/phosphate translocator n=1 Tax=Hibiscus syriacus TaxID=106335 RepID=A0A6A3AVS7_HIBSY|nr:putative sugar phosphate/phosphate translocator [Hibiscus syriacus]
MCSGKKVNYSKSRFFCCPSSPAAMRDKLSNILVVELTDNPGSYLGMPLIIGRNRTAAFGYLQDKVATRVQGWTKNMLSYGGPAMFIKSVGQALPAYMMGCFLIPDGILREISTILQFYWWPGDLGNRVWPLIAWNTICQPKRMGGLGFINLHVFYLAMLAKHIWRFLRHPIVPVQLSDVYLDNPENPIRVEDFMVTNEPRWNERLIREVFAVEDASTILRTPIAPIQLDLIVWAGHSSVHAACFPLFLFASMDLYHWTMEAMLLGFHRLIPGLLLLKFQLIVDVTWQLRIQWVLSPKYFNFLFPMTLTMIHMAYSGIVAFFLVRVFKFGNTAYLHISVAFIQMLKALMLVATFFMGVMCGTDKPRCDVFLNMVLGIIGVVVYMSWWSYMLAVLDVHEALSVRRRMFLAGIVDGLCSLCGQWEEVVLHALRKCSKVWPLYQVAGLPPFLTAGSLIHVDHELQHCKIPDYSSSWRKPPAGYVKVNVNGACLLQSGYPAVGVVVRDSEGMVLAGRGSYLDCPQDSMLVEAHALCTGLRLAVALGYSKVLVGSDAQSLVHQVHHFSFDFFGVAVYSR